jgi:hypothetical protein
MEPVLTKVSDHKGSQDDGLRTWFGKLLEEVLKKWIGDEEKGF